MSVRSYGRGVIPIPGDVSNAVAKVVRAGIPLWVEGVDFIGQSPSKKFGCIATVYTRKPTNETRLFWLSKADVWVVTSLLLNVELFPYPFFEDVRVGRSWKFTLAALGTVVSDEFLNVFMERTAYMEWGSFARRWEGDGVSDRIMAEAAAAVMRVGRSSGQAFFYTHNRLAASKSLKNPSRSLPLIDFVDAVLAAVESRLYPPAKVMVRTSRGGLKMEFDEERLTGLPSSAALAFRLLVDGSAVVTESLLSRVYEIEMFV